MKSHKQKVNEANERAVYRSKFSDAEAYELVRTRRGESKRESARLLARIVSSAKKEIK